jgi:N-acetylglucosaminyldiphosphoundecaprenol N-acetyl-beta-D-mannosaminyltransferase
MNPRKQAQAGRQNLFGLPMDANTMDAAVQRCLDAVEREEPLEVGVVNAAKIVAMGKNPELAASVSGCGMIVADGQAVVWASRALRRPLPERVAGIDLFTNLLAKAEERGLRVYFLGAKDEVLEAMLANLAVRFPKLTVAGSRNGYFPDSDAPAVAEAIGRTEPDLLFLGMTSPKKENFVAAYGATTGAMVVHGVGGSFDILAGKTKRAPESWQRLGMEWLYRALQEPRRLGKRYLTTNLAFIGLVLRESGRGPGR